jgi:O-antigen/teichoic acid export membrane protein
MKLFLVFITLVLIIFFINVLGYPKNTIYVVYFLSASIILNGFIQSFKSIYQAYEKMEYVSLFNILNTIFLLAGVLIAINQQFNVIAFAAIYFVTSFIILTLNIFVIQIKFTKFSFLIEMDFWKTILKEAFPFGLSGIFVVIYFYIDSVMLSLMKSDEVVGWYNASYKLVFILLFIPAVYFSSIYPVMSNLFIHSKDTLKFIYSTSLKYMLILGVLMGISTIILADQIILLIYGTEYQPSILALKILIWAVFFSFLAHAPMYILNSTNKQVIYTKVVFIGMIVNVIMNFILIPKYSLIGASVATVFTEFLGFFLLYFMVITHTESRFEIKFISRILFGVLLLITSYYLFNPYIGKIISLFTGYIFFFISLIVLKVISDKDLLVLKNLIKRT